MVNDSRNVFIPKPNVDSIVVEFSKKDSLLYLKDTQTFYKLIRDSFKQKRKTLKNNLKDYNLIKIEETLDKIKQLNDICKFSYITALKLFDPSYSTKDSYTPEFQPVPIELLENSLLDLYFVIAEMDITNSLYNAVIALFRLKKGGKISDRETQGLKENFKKIQYIVKHIFTKEILSCMIRISKKNYELVPERAVYNGKSRQKYWRRAYLRN